MFLSRTIIAAHTLHPWMKESGTCQAGS